MTIELPIRREGGFIYDLLPNGKKDIGFPNTNKYDDKHGADFYVSTKSDLTIRVTEDNSYPYHKVTCVTAFRFKPEEGKNYELSSFAQKNENNEPICKVHLIEVYEDATKKGTLYREVPRTPVIVPESPAWNAVCARRN